jgi:hypothetical protein
LIGIFVCTFLQLLHALQKISFWNVFKLPCHCTMNFFYCLKMPPFLREILTWGRESSRQVQDLKMKKLKYIEYTNCLPCNIVAMLLIV